MTGRVYRAHFLVDERGATVFCHYATVSPCGGWVEAGNTRWRHTDEWFAMEVEARASKADEIIALADKLKEQAEELKADAERCAKEG